MTDVRMPQLADGMEQGTIVKWLLPEGATVAVGDELFEVETDKATMACEAEAAGMLAIVAPEGATVPVGEVVARVGHAAPAELAPEPEPEPEPVAVAAAPPEAPPAVAPEVRDGNGRAALATPLARRIAAVHGLALGDLDGSGPGGRIVKADVLAAAGVEDPAPAAAPPPPAPAPAAAPPPPPAPRGAARIVQPSRVQRLVAERMAASKATVPHFQVATEATMDAALELRAGLKAAAAEGAPVPSVNDLIVRACALALCEHPLLNASYVDGGFALHDEVHVGMAVTTDDGLVVTTVRDADRKALSTIAREARELAGRAREGRATAAELGGATFSVSNLGMFGATAITPVINPPQAAILGVGAVRPVLARVDGEVVDRQLVTLTLSADHRVVNGADAARFLADVRAGLEAPLRLV